MSLEFVFFYSSILLLLKFRLKQLSHRPFQQFLNISLCVQSHPLIHLPHFLKDKFNPVTSCLKFFNGYSLYMINSPMLQDESTFLTLWPLLTYKWSILSKYTSQSTREFVLNIYVPSSIVEILVQQVWSGAQASIFWWSTRGNAGTHWERASSPTNTLPSWDIFRKLLTTLCGMFSCTSYRC